MRQRTCPSCGATYAWWRTGCFHGIYTVSLIEFPRLRRFGRWLSGDRSPERTTGERTGEKPACYYPVCGCDRDHTSCGRPGGPLLYRGETTGEETIASIHSEWVSSKEKLLNQAQAIARGVPSGQED